MAIEILKKRFFYAVRHKPLNFVQNLYEQNPALILDRADYLSTPPAIQVYTAWGTRDPEESDRVAIFLATHGAELNVQTKEGLTPAMYACNYGSAEAVDCYIKHGADLKTKSSIGETLLLFAARNLRHSEAEKMVPLLLGYGIDINAKTMGPFVKTALIIAALAQKCSFLQLLLDAGATGKEVAIENAVQSECYRNAKFLGWTGEFKSWKDKSPK